MSAIRRRRAVLGAVLTLILLPLALAAVQAASYHIRYRDTDTIVSSGERRGYVLHVPPRYDGANSTPLVISLHGAGGWGAAQEETSQWDRVADAEGFIVVYPSGAERAGGRVWNAWPGHVLRKDVRFIADLIDTLEAAYHIDPARIYVNGLSNGGGMSFVLSCTLGDRIAAVGVVAGAQMLPWRWCADHRPMPMIAFHGTADPVVPYHGGTTWVYEGRFPDVPRWVAGWAERNRCVATPTATRVAADVTRHTYAGCADDAAVVLYTIAGGGHTWPGGEPMPEWFVGRTTASIDASRLMWAFFRAHPLRR